MRQYRVRRIGYLSKMYFAEVRSSFLIFVTEWQPIKVKFDGRILYTSRDEAYAAVAHHRFCRNDRDYLDRSSVALA